MAIDDVSAWSAVPLSPPAALARLEYIKGKPTSQRGIADLPTLIWIAGTHDCDHEQRFLAASMAVAVLNIWPYLKSRGARAYDGREVAGVPLTFRRAGGFATVDEWLPLALLADIAIAARIILMASRDEHRVNSWAGSSAGGISSSGMHALLKQRMRLAATLVLVGLILSGAPVQRANAVSVSTEGASTTMQVTDRETIRLLEAFAEAWNRHDVNALMSMMTSDAVFEASGGNMVDGEKHVGERAVRAAYAAVFELYPDAHWGNARHFVAGDRGVSEWTFTGTMKDGRRVEVTGCDLFTFRDGKIAIKNSFRKNRPPIG